MQSFLVYSALCVTAAFAAAVPCGPNEEFTQCASFCPHTCQNHTQIEKCPEICVIGCACTEGFVKHSMDGPCVRKEECTKLPKCGENEVFRLCNTACPATCDDSTPNFCPTQCVQGCACKEGYIRDTKHGKCVPENTCVRKVCKENEIYKECGSACPATCAEPARNCQKSCSRGCFCKDGYILDDETRECVKIEECF